MTSVFAIAGVTMEGPEDVYFLRLRTTFIYYSRLLGENFTGRAPVTDLRCLRGFLVCMLVTETSTYFPRSMLSPHYVIPLYDSL